MNKIKNITVSVKNYHYWHKRLWNKVIQLLKENFDIYNSGDSYKTHAYNLIFHEDLYISAMCFGCEWVKHAKAGTRICNISCLFEIKGACLNGLWNKFSLNPNIELAKQIRDFPIREEYK